MAAWRRLHAAWRIDRGEVRRWNFRDKKHPERHLSFRLVAGPDLNQQPFEPSRAPAQGAGASLAGVGQSLVKAEPDTVSRKVRFDPALWCPFGAKLVPSS